MVIAWNIRRYGKPYQTHHQSFTNQAPAPLFRVSSEDTAEPSEEPCVSSEEARKTTIAHKNIMDKIKQNQNENRNAACREKTEIAYQR